MRVYTTDRYYMRGRGGLMASDPDGFIRGRGIASIFGRIFSSVVPLVKGALNIGKRVAKSDVGRSLAKEVKKSATQAGINVVSDALKGKNIIQSSKRALAQVGENVGNKLESSLAQTSSSSGSSAALRPKPRARPKRPKVKGRLKLKPMPKRGGGSKKKKKKKKKCNSTSKKKSPKSRGVRMKISSLFD